MCLILVTLIFALSNFITAKSFPIFKINHPHQGGCVFTCVQWFVGLLAGLNKLLN